MTSIGEFEVVIIFFTIPIKAMLWGGRYVSYQR